MIEQVITKTKEIERGLRWKSVPEVTTSIKYQQQTPNETLEHEKEELNELNSRLQQLLDLLRSKKHENDQLELEIKLYKNKLRSATNADESAIGVELVEHRKELNKLSNESSERKIKLIRSQYELDRLRDKYNQELNLQSSIKTKLHLLETQKTDTDQELLSLKENLVLKEDIIARSIEKNNELKKELERFLSEYDDACGKRVHVQTQIQSLIEKIDFEFEIFKLMRDELKKLYLTDTNGQKILNLELFYEQELKSIRDKIRADFMKINEWNLEVIKRDYEVRYSQYVEEHVLEQERNADELKQNSTQNDEFIKEYNQNKLLLKDQKLKQFQLKKKLDEFLLKLKENRTRVDSGKAQKQQEIEYLNQQIGNIKTESWDLLNFSKVLDSEVAIYARLLNEHLNTQQERPVFSLDKYRETIFNTRIKQQQPQLTVDDAEHKRRRNQEAHLREKLERDRLELLRKLQEDAEENERLKKRQQQIQAENETKKRQADEQERNLRHQQQLLAENEIKRRQVEEHEKILRRQEQIESEQTEHELKKNIYAQELIKQQQQQINEYEKRTRQAAEESELVSKQKQQQSKYELIKRKVEETIWQKQLLEEKEEQQKEVESEKKCKQQIDNSEAELKKKLNELDEKAIRELKKYHLANDTITNTTHTTLTTQETNELIQRNFKWEQEMSQKLNNNKQVDDEIRKLQIEQEQKKKQQQQHESLNKVIQIEKERVEQEKRTKIEIDKQEAEHRYCLELEQAKLIKKQQQEQEKQRQIEFNEMIRTEREKLELEKRRLEEERRVEYEERIHREQNERKVLREEQEQIEQQENKLRNLKELKINQINENNFPKEKGKNKSVYFDSNEINTNEKHSSSIHELKNSTTKKTQSQTQTTTTTTSKNIEILKEKRNSSGLVENIVDHCVSSSSGRKQVLILDNEKSSSPSQSIQIKDIKSGDTREDKMSKHALKHKANRYVSGAIGILETSVNGEYIILENLSSSKVVNLNGWFLHRYVPDQSINIIYKFPHDVWLKSGQKLKIWSSLAAKKFSTNQLDPHTDLIAEHVYNWGVYSKYSVTKLINPEGIDKAVLTQTLLRLSSSSTNLCIKVPIQQKETTELTKTITTTTTTSKNEQTSFSNNSSMKTSTSSTNVKQQQ